jgi:transcriptional regulator with XRE-family HTH domain
MPEQSSQFKLAVAKKAKERNMSLRKLAIELGISHSYLSEILSEKKRFDRELGHKLADFFGISWIDLYHEIGWLGEDEEFIAIVKKYYRENSDFAEFSENIISIWDKEYRLKMLRFVVDNFHNVKTAAKLVKGKNGRLMPPNQVDRE